MDEDRVEEEELLKALKLDDAVFGLPELMYQATEWITALQLQHLEWFLQHLECFLHFYSTLGGMVRELLDLQTLESCQENDQQEQDFDHHNLTKMKMFKL